MRRERERDAAEAATRTLRARPGLCARARAAGVRLLRAGGGRAGVRLLRPRLLFRLLALFLVGGGSLQPRGLLFRCGGGGLSVRLLVLSTRRSISRCGTSSCSSSPGLAGRSRGGRRRAGVGRRSARGLRRAVGSCSGLRRRAHGHLEPRITVSTSSASLSTQRPLADGRRNSTLRIKGKVPTQGPKSKAGNSR